MPDGADTTRDAVAAAYKEVVSRSEPASAPEPAAEPAPEPAAAASPAPEPESGEPSKTEPKRDGKGRFIVPPKQKPAASEKVPASTAPAGTGGAVSVPPPVVGAAPPVSPAMEALKPPQDWRATAREKWAGLPREIQEEALRTHIESRKVLSEAAEHRKNWQTFQQTVAPYEMLLRTNGFQDPTQAVGALLQREAILHHGTLEQKAQLFANGFRAYMGGDPRAIELFAKAMDAEPQQQSAPQQVDPRQIVAQAKQELFRELQQHRDQQLNTSVRSEIDEFDGSHEFVNDRDVSGDYTKDAMKLRRIMSTIMSEAAEDGEVKTMQQAYDEALMLHPVFAPIVKQREAAKAATAKAATTQAARAASSSIRSEPSGPSNGKPMDVRESVSQAYYAQKNAH